VAVQYELVLVLGVGVGLAWCWEVWCGVGLVWGEVVRVGLRLVFGCRGVELCGVGLVFVLVLGWGWVGAKWGSGWCSCLCWCWYWCTASLVRSSLTLSAANLCQGKAVLRQSAALYKLGEVLGEGTYGVVFKASRGDLALVAKKFKDPKYTVEEAVLCDLLRHPRIVAVRDAFLIAPLDFYLVYDFAGSDLAAVLKATSPGPQLVRSAMLQMLLGLEHIHSKGIIHSDMKPQNVLVETVSDNQWNICIGDLGSAIEVRSCC
jgi:hypothetical protein